MLLDLLLDLLLDCTRINSKTLYRHSLASIKVIATESIQSILVEIRVATDEWLIAE